MPDATRTYVGGSFAPTIDARKLADYRKLADGADSQVGEYMDALLDMADLYLARPAAKGKAKDTRAAEGSPHPSGKGMIVALSKDEVDRLWDAVPWAEELDTYGRVFDRIDAAADKPTRDAAFHLLWVGYELVRDRHPIFSDQL